MPTLFHPIWHVWTGKSELARHIVSSRHAVLVSTDLLWKSSYSSPDYTNEDQRWAVYTHALEIAWKSLGEGKDVVMDGMFWSQAYRDHVKQIAHNTHALYQQIELTVTDEALLKERILKRRDRPDRDSDGDREVYLRLKNKREPSEDTARRIIPNNGSVPQLQDTLQTYISTL